LANFDQFPTFYFIASIFANFWAFLKYLKIGHFWPYFKYDIWQVFCELQPFLPVFGLSIANFLIIFDKKFKKMLVIFAIFCQWSP
jgi:hypothetical protein